jgi:hypothetical protein
MWHEQVCDPTWAYGILDRLANNAHRIEMRGDSMRKNRGKVRLDGTRKRYDEDEETLLKRPP